MSGPAEDPADLDPVRLVIRRIRIQRWVARAVPEGDAACRRPVRLGDRGRACRRVVRRRRGTSAAGSVSGARTRATGWARWAGRGVGVGVAGGPLLVAGLPVARPPGGGTHAPTSASVIANAMAGAADHGADRSFGPSSRRSPGCARAVADDTRSIGASAGRGRLGVDRRRILEPELGREREALGRRGDPIPTVALGDEARAVGCEQHLGRGRAVRREARDADGRASRARRDP